MGRPLCVDASAAARTSAGWRLAVASLAGAATLSP